MDWAERMNRALDYIEAHLTEELDCGEIARAAATSAHHFPRLFVAVADVTLSEYVRRRRLSRAAQDLREDSVLDVALRYGYESADAFSRAFYRQHGVHPAQVRSGGARLTFYPRLSFHFRLQGDAHMNYRLEEMDALRVVGRRFRVDTKHAFEIVPGIWQREMAGGFLPRLIDMSWEKPKCKLESLLGVIGDKPRIDDETFDYIIAVRYDGPTPGDMEEWMLPAAMWAVFPLAEDAWKRVYSEWLPSSGYELADAPFVECHFPPDHEPSSELWVPVIPAGRRADLS